MASLELGKQLELLGALPIGVASCCFTLPGPCLLPTLCLLLPCRLSGADLWSRLVRDARQDCRERRNFELGISQTARLWAQLLSPRSRRPLVAQSLCWRLFLATPLHVADAVRETKVVLSVGAAFPDWDDVIDGDALWMRM